jgi:hypothetical protein
MDAVRTAKHAAAGLEGIGLAAGFSVGRPKEATSGARLVN